MLIVDAIVVLYANSQGCFPRDTHTSCPLVRGRQCDSSLLYTLYYYTTQHLAQYEGENHIQYNEHEVGPLRSKSFKLQLCPFAYCVAHHYPTLLWPVDCMIIGYAFWSGLAYLSILYFGSLSSHNGEYLCYYEWSFSNNIYRRQCLSLACIWWFMEQYLNKTQKNINLSWISDLS